jgi:hypothetical protein
MKTIKIKNCQEFADTYCGQEIGPGQYYSILDESEAYKFYCDQKVNNHLSANPPLILVNDGVSDLSFSDGKNLLDTDTRDVNIVSQSPFASKTLGTNKLYKRIHGIQRDVVVGTNTFLWSIPYPWVKITSVEIINGKALDTASLYILDSEAGTYSGVPNKVLNQFVYDVNMVEDFYENGSEYDADLYQGMQLKIVYNTLQDSRVGFNFKLNEVK